MTGSNCRTAIASHRGGALIWPENSPTAFRKTASLPLDYVEFDVQQTRDGILAVFHDATLDRMTDGQGPLGDRTWDELQVLRINGSFAFADGGEQIPTLDDVISIFAPSPVDLRLEIKPQRGLVRYQGIEKSIMEVLDSANMLDRTVVTSFLVDVLDDVRVEGSPRSVLWLVGDMVYRCLGGTRGVLAVARHHDVPEVGIHADFITGDAVKRAADVGIALGAYAAHDEARIRRVLDARGHVFTSDRPDLAIRLRSQSQS